MFYNKYQHISDLTFLKSRKPRKRILPQGPDLGSFRTGNINLKRLANFGLEMMKFLPEYEQLAYAGKVEGEDHTFQMVEGRDMQVSQEWWDAFNKYEITAEDLQDNHIYDFYEGREDYDAGNIAAGRSNAEVIDAWLNGCGNNASGWSVLWAFGKHHRVGPFMEVTEGSKMFAGEGDGGGYSNLDFVTKADEWNHIKWPKSQEWDQSIDSYVNQGHFVDEFGVNWQDIQDLLDTKFPGKSYYEIVMSGAYKSITDPREAFLLVAAMYESRARAWQCMTEVFGPVTSTWSDQEMISHIDDFIDSSNPYLNHHTLGIFKLFLEMQHSFTNQVTMFYEKAQGGGFNKSVIDDKRFWDFAKWLGRATYNNDGSQESGEPLGKLYEYRNSFGEGTAEYEAANNLIEKWFGAASVRKRVGGDLVQNDVPVWQGYGTELKDGYNPDNAWGGEWVTIDGSGRQYLREGFVNPDPSHFMSLGWDRKFWSGNLRYRVPDGDGWDHNHVIGMVESNWGSLTNMVYGRPDLINTLATTSHKDYTSASLSGLNQYDVRGMGPNGHYYYNNWAVHAVGRFLKDGIDRSMVAVMTHNSQRRVARVQFKQDKTDWSDRKEELEYEKKMEERAAQKAIQKRRNLLKKMGKPEKGGNQQNNSKNREHKIGSKEYEKSMQKLRQRLLKANKKRKAWLQQISGQGAKKK